DHEISRILGSRWVREGRHQGLVENPRRFVPPGDGEVGRVHAIDATADALPGLADELFAIFLRLELSGKPQPVSIEPDLHVGAVNRMRGIDISPQARGP